MTISNIFSVIMTLHGAVVVMLLLLLLVIVPFSVIGVTAIDDRPLIKKIPLLIVLTGGWFLSCLIWGCAFHRGKWIKTLCIISTLLGLGFASLFIFGLQPWARETERTLYLSYQHLKKNVNLKHLSDEQLTALQKKYDHYSQFLTKSYQSNHFSLTTIYTINYAASFAHIIDYVTEDGIFSEDDYRYVMKIKSQDSNKKIKKQLTKHLHSALQGL